MKKIIRVIVGPKGETRIETKGFSGGLKRLWSFGQAQVVG